MDNIGKHVLIRRALFIGKSDGRDFRNHLSTRMRHMGFISCLEDPDLWMRPTKKSER